jgi:hypothetical protein
MELIVENGVRDVVAELEEGSQPASVQVSLLVEN